MFTTSPRWPSRMRVGRLPWPAGRAVGEEKGLVRGLRRSIEDLCFVMGIEWSAEREARVEALSFSELESLKERLVKQKRWP